MISIVTRTYNRPGKLLHRCMPSVLAQLVPWEWIVVGDGTDEETVAAMSSISDSRIRFFQRQRPVYPKDKLQRWHVQGVDALNWGIVQSHGEWVMFLDDDDELLPHALGVLQAFAERFDTDVVYGQSETYKLGKFTGQLYGAWPPAEGQPTPGAYIWRRTLDMRWESTLDTPADADFWQRLIAREARFTFVPAVLHRYHRGYP